MSSENQEKYLGWNGQELHTPGGEVITVADVASESIKHTSGLTMDSKGRVILPTQGNYFLAVDPHDTNKSEWYATKDATVDGPRKINSVEMWEHPTDPSKSQVIGIENDHKEDGTVGEISPLLVETSEGTFVAVQKADRFGRKYVEAFRRGWTRPADEAPEVRVLNDQFTVDRYTEEDLGLTHSNNARLVAPNGKKALINNKLTVIRSPNNSKPEVSGAEWMPIEQFVTMTEEGMGKGTVDTAVVLGIVTVDQARLDSYKAQMAVHVKALKSEALSK